MENIFNLGYQQLDANLVNTKINVKTSTKGVSHLIKLYHLPWSCSDEKPHNVLHSLIVVILFIDPLNKFCCLYFLFLGGGRGVLHAFILFYFIIFFYSRKYSNWVFKAKPADWTNSPMLQAAYGSTFAGYLLTKFDPWASRVCSQLWSIHLVAFLPMACKTTPRLFCLDFSCIHSPTLVL